jgi:GNAT superfamily N-acetyltransferase
MNEIVIRPASLSDRETLLRFEQGVITAERPFDSTLKPGQISYYDLEELITAAHSELLLAELDSRPIGCGYARIETAKPYLNHERYSYVGFIYVEPDHRGKGVSAKIIEALKRWSLAQNVNEMRLEVYHDNVAAIRAYEKVGFSKHMLEMRIGIEG